MRNEKYRCSTILDCQSCIVNRALSIVHCQLCIVNCIYPIRGRMVRGKGASMASRPARKISEGKITGIT